MVNGRNTFREYVTTPGRKFSLAARAEASKVGRSSSLQRIRCRARSREIGLPGRRSASSAAHDAPSSLVAVPMAVGVTVFGSAVCGWIESYNSGQWPGGRCQSIQTCRFAERRPPARAGANGCYRDVSTVWCSSLTSVSALEYPWQSQPAVETAMALSLRACQTTLFPL